AQRTLKLGCWPYILVDTRLQEHPSHSFEPGQHEGQRLAQVPNHDLELRIPVEGAAKDHPNNVERSVDVPAPARSGQQISHLGRKSAIERLDDRLRRQGRVDVDRYVDPFCAFQDRPVECVVQVTAAVVPVDDRTFEPILTNTAFKLFSSPGWCSGGQCGKSGETRWMSRYGIGKEIIHFTRALDCLLSL